MPGLTPESEMQFLHSLEYWSFKDFSRQFHRATRVENQCSKGTKAQTCMTFRALAELMDNGNGGKHTLLTVEPRLFGVWIRYVLCLPAPSRLPQTGSLCNSPGCPELTSNS